MLVSDSITLYFMRRTNILLSLFALSLLLQLASSATSISQLILSSYGINVPSTYRWTISFDSSTSRSDINLTFPAACKLSGSTTASISGTTLNSSISGNTLVITSSTLLRNTVTIVVTNVQNPNSAISTFAFTASTVLDSTFSLSQSSAVLYTKGSMASCSWSFSQCTEQPASNLTISATITNPINTGTKQFRVGYGKWVNHNSKDMLTGVSIVTSLVSLDGGSTYTAVTSTAIDTSSKIITISYSQSIQFNASNILYFILMGVNSPPTQTTTTTANYFVATADSSGAQIDYTTSLTVAQTCVYNLTGGTFANTNMPVNSLYYSPQIAFSQTPIISLQASDTVELSFTPLANFNGCSFLKLWRNINNSMQATLTQTNTNYQYTLPSANSQYSYTLTLAPVCSDLLITGSETPKNVVFLFKREGSPYLQLTATMYPSATVIDSSSASLSLSSYQMTASSAQYTFAVTTAQPLGTGASLKITSLPSTATIPATPSCTVSLSSGTLLSYSCSYDSANHNLTVTLSTSAILPSSTTITIVVLGITNPSSPSSHTLGVQTYYDSTVSTSRVEYSTTAFSITYTGITAFPATINPTSLTVYTTTQMVITLTTTIAVPSGSTIYVEFPAQATQITVGTNPLSINDTVASTVSTNHNNNSYSFTYANSIATDSTLTITTSIRSPSSMGTYKYVIVRITVGSTLYIQSNSAMSLAVDSVSSMPVTITPATPTTGQTSVYTIAMTVTVPHPSSFLVRVTLPSDVRFTSSGASCTGNCSSTMTSLNSSAFQLTASDSQSGSTGHNLTFTLAATFTNPRAMGASALWSILTATSSPSSTITTSTAAPKITTPNTLTAAFLTDSYYINSTKVVKMSFTFTNSLQSGDRLLWMAPTTTYSEYSTIACSPIFGTCTKEAALSTSSTLVVSIIPNLTSIINGTLSLTLQGLISGNDSTNSITVRSFNSSTYTYMLDSGILTYSISCIDSALSSVANNCKTCHANGSCIDCQTSYGFYLNGTVCVSDCGLATSYMNYNGTSGACTSCTNNCYMCYSATACKNCQINYYYFANQSCLSTCPSAGYISSIVNSQLYCYQCYGSGYCLTCTSSAPGYCTLCSNNSILSNGICSTSCANNSMYASGGFCYNCDVSCSTCTSGGNSGCTACALNYYSFNNFCVSSCPTDTVANASGVCTCELPCVKCTGTTSYCTACNDSAMFVSQGQCLSSCPNQTYLSGSTCIDCSTGCSNCSSTTCFSCLTNYYLYNNACYSDCNLVGRQFDISGSKCVLCPDGCDTCSGTICSSCLTDYTLSSSTQQCIQTCLLSGSCESTYQSVLPMPGLLVVVIWTGIAIAIKVILQKSYLPYSMILFNSIVEFILVIAVIANAGDLAQYSVSRLLASSNSQRMTIRALLGTSIATNYLTNIAYIFIFIKYIKPLMNNPRQIDFISNIVVLVIGSLTNYRLALMAFSKLFPKPYIHINIGSKLTPVHYLCITSLILDIFPIVACAMAIYNEAAGNNLFMLSIDLLIVIALNIIITIWFVACSKPEEYYQDNIKKYHIEEQHNATNETIANDKDFSKANIVANDTYNFTDEEVMSNQMNLSTYKKIQSPERINRRNINTTQVNVATDEEKISSGEEFHVIPVRNRQGKMRTSSMYDPYSDPNYEVSLKPRNSGRMEIVPTRDLPLTTSKLSEGKGDEDGLAGKTKSSPHNFSKKDLTSPKTRLYGQNEVDHQLPDLPEESDDEKRKSVFQNFRQKLPRPKRTNTQKRNAHQKSSPTKGKALEASPDKIQPHQMRRTNKVGYFESDALQSNQEEDIESIIKQKVHQSTIKKPMNEQNRFVSDSNNSEVANEQISPSWFNIQNQRIDLSDFDEHSQN